MWNHQQACTKSAWLHARRRIKGSEVGTVIRIDRVVCFKAYCFILSCIFTSKLGSMQISLVWHWTHILLWLFLFCCCCTLLCTIAVHRFVQVWRGFFFFTCLQVLGAGCFEWACMSECLALCAPMFVSRCVCVFV